MGQISGSGVQKELMAEHPVHNANDTNISTYLIANIKLRRDGLWNLAQTPLKKELVPLKQVVKLRRDLSANDTSRHPKLLKIGPNHQCQ